MVAEAQYAIETFSLTKVFRDLWGRAKVVAVDGLNLKVRHNEIYGFLGPNGSGKTTTLKMLLNLLHPSKGRALVLGGTTGDPLISRRIGYLPEESYLYPYLSARETLDFFGKLFGLPNHVRNNRIEALLEMVGLMGMANRPVGTFSKGMARRIGLAQALINDPELLILDEPTSGMDPIGTRQIKDLILNLARRGKTILLCSHLLADVEDVCDRIGILYGGRMQVEGSVRSLLQQSNRNQIVTGPLSDQALGRIRQIITEEKTDVEMSSPMDKLEEFFIRIVTKAQQEKLPTSGAVSTTKIGDFLAREQQEKTTALLDQLVSASMELVPQGDAMLEKVHTEEKSQAPREDRELLSRLAKQKMEPVVRLEETQATELTSVPTDKSMEQVGDETVRKSVLESLIGPDKGQSGDAGTEITRPDSSEEDEDVS
ncbi:MAG: ABC transporter ATP-binding protein [Sedimentisphaerales bacterium]|nr:ABC transporter ATP-binding protein [Sedimentisphaerales bacterium]